MRRQPDWPEAHAHQAAHGDPERLEHAPDLAVVPFAQHDLVPAVRSAAPARGDAVEPGRAVGQSDPLSESAELFARELAPHPHRVLVVDFVARMHEAVGELAGVGEEQETGCPSSATRSAGPTRSPNSARAPFTLSLPETIAASMSRREPRPERARTL